MMKTLKKANEIDKTPYSRMKRVQDIIPINRIWEDGIFLVGNRYAKTYAFSDVNFSVANDETQLNILTQYSAFLNSLDSDADTKITINNRSLDKKTFSEEVLIPRADDGLDLYRDEYNKIIMSKAQAGSGIVQERYVTVSIYKKNIEEARTYFARVLTDFTKYFAAPGSKIRELDAVEKLRVLHDFYHPDDVTDFKIDLKDLMRKGHDFKDLICPDYCEHYKDYLVLGNKYARVLYLKDYATAISTDFIAQLMDRSRQMMLSLDVLPIPVDEAVRDTENRLLGIETNITNWQKKQNQNNNFSAEIPYDMEQQRIEMKEFLNDLTNRNQRMMLSVITLVHLADNLEQLNADTDSIVSFAKTKMCSMVPATFQQLDALNTVLPIGTRKMDQMRTLTTESLAAFMPFKAQEIQEPGGIYFGENAISHNLILCNVANLLNQSMLLLGVPGSGKSFFAKLLIIFLALSSKEDIIICDPEGEYTPLVKAIGGSVIQIAAGGKDRVNAMDMVEGYGDTDPIADKSQFIMSLIEQISPNEVGAYQKSIIDRCVALAYKRQRKTGQVPTLKTLRNLIIEQPEDEANYLALALELFTDGSLDIFAHETNVNTNNRIISYDIHNLGSQLKPVGLLTITDAIINRVNANWKKGKRAHLFIDEFHVVYENEQSGNFFTSAWRQFRKRNTYPCAITQNVEYLLASEAAKSMLSNSEFVVMLNQATSDRDQLQHLYNITPEQMSYVTNADAGCGLIRYGERLVPFVNKIPNNTDIYKLITTKPGEGAFSGRQS